MCCGCVAGHRWSRVSVGRAISSAVVTPMGEQFHDEHLELLPSEVTDFETMMGAGDDVQQGIDEDDM